MPLNSFALIGSLSCLQAGDGVPDCSVEGGIEEVPHHDASDRAVRDGHLGASVAGTTDGRGAISAGAAAAIVLFLLVLTGGCVVLVMAGDQSRNVRVCAEASGSNGSAVLR